MAALKHVFPDDYLGNIIQYKTELINRRKIFENFKYDKKLVRRRMNCCYEQLYTDGVLIQTRQEHFWLMIWDWLCILSKTKIFVLAIQQNNEMNTNHRHVCIQTKQKEYCNSHIELFQSRFIKNARIELPLGIMEFPASRNMIYQ
jgi:hypothetical protein